MGEPGLDEPHSSITGGRAGWFRHPVVVGVAAAAAALVVALGVFVVGAGDDDTAPQPAATDTAVTTTISVSSTTTTTLDRDSLLDRAARQWRTMVATDLSDSLWIPEPVIGPGDSPVVVSATGPTARVWDFDPDDGWGVATTIELEGQTAMVSDAVDLAVPGSATDVAVADGSGDDLRLLVPTYYGNGPAVSAIGFRDGTWQLLAFTGWAAGPYATDATIEDGQLVVWVKDCVPNCAEGTSTPVHPERTAEGYHVPEPAPPPPPSAPPSVADPVEAWSDALRELVVAELGPADSWGCDGASGPVEPGTWMWCHYESPWVMVWTEVIDSEGRFAWSLVPPEEAH